MRKDDLSRAGFGLTLALLGLGLIGLGALAQMQGLGTGLVAWAGLTETIFGLSTLLGGPTVFAGLFALAIGRRHDARGPAKSTDDYGIAERLQRATAGQMDPRSPRARGTASSAPQRR